MALSFIYEALRILTSALVEIRLEIYDYLVIARSSKSSYESTSHDLPRNLIDPSSSSLIRGPLRFWLFGDHSAEVQSCILRTCRKIHDEVAPLIYRKNGWYFHVPESFSEELWEPPTVAGIQSKCAQLFDYDKDKLPSVLRRNSFAHFLNQIGRKNAANLIRVCCRIDAYPPSWEDTRPHLFCTMKIILLLLQLHTPCLKELTFSFRFECCNFSAMFDRMDLGMSPGQDAKNMPEVVWDALHESRGLFAKLKKLELCGFQPGSIIEAKAKKMEIRTLPDASDHSKDHMEI